VGWFSAGELVSKDQKMSGRDTRLIGKALARLERDGLVDGKMAAGNRKLYYFRKV
jgi:hypothetical protein